MAYTIKHEHDLIEVSLTEKVDAVEMIEIARNVADIERRLAVTPNRLCVICPQAEISTNFMKMQGVVELRNKAPIRNPVRGAFVTRDHHHFGLARMFQSLCVHPRVEIHICADRDEAMRWLRDGIKPAATPVI